jgi:hypothetical protein
MTPPTDRQKRILTASVLIVITALLQYIEEIGQRTAYHDSILTGEKWVSELLQTRNPNRFYEQLGLHKDTFIKLIRELESLYLIRHTRYTSTEEAVAIFLYSAVTNLSNRKVAERFQRSGDTISR